MSPPNATWRDIIQQAGSQPEVLKQPDVVRNVANILATNASVCSSLGHPFLAQIQLIYIDMLNLYKCAPLAAPSHTLHCMHAAASVGRVASMIALVSCSATPSSPRSSSSTSTCSTCTSARPRCPVLHSVTGMLLHMHCFAVQPLMRGCPGIIREVNPGTLLSSTELCASAREFLALQLQ